MLSNATRIVFRFSTIREWDNALCDLGSAVRVYIVRHIRVRQTMDVELANTVCQFIMRVDGGHIGLCDAIDLAAVVKTAIPRMIEEATAQVTEARAAISELGGITPSHPTIRRLAEAKQREHEVLGRIARLNAFCDMVAAIAQNAVEQMLVQC